jgi:hypothetical protein
LDYLERMVNKIREHNNVFYVAQIFEPFLNTIDTYTLAFSKNTYIESAFIFFYNLKGSQLEGKAAEHSISTSVCNGNW